MCVGGRLDGVTLIERRGGYSLVWVLHTARSVHALLHLTDSLLHDPFERQTCEPAGYSYNTWTHFRLKAVWFAWL